MAEPLPVVPFASAENWEAWLEENHDQSAGLWLKLAKKGSGIPSVTYEEALEVAICHGWIDGQKDKLDERFWLQKFTPRRQRSMWSKANRERAERLIAAGRMRPAGREQIELAREDGRWEAAYDSPSTATVPAELQAALDANPDARDFFASLNSQNRYAILFRIQTAKRPETRAARIEKYVAMLSKGGKLYP